MILGNNCNFQNYSKLVCSPQLKHVIWIATIDIFIFSQFQLMQNSDIHCLNPADNPMDTVQQLIWSKDNKMFATAGWDGYLRIYSINNKSGFGTLEIVFKRFLQHPIIAMGWDESINVVFVGLANGHVKAVQLATNTVHNILKLDSPICKLFWESINKYLIVIPFDSKIILLQLNPSQQIEINVDEKIVTADLSFPFLCIATDRQHWGIINLNQNNICKPKYQASPLDKYGKITTMCINAQSGHLGIGSFEGRGCFLSFDKTKLTVINNFVIFKTQYEKESINNSNESITKLYYTSSLDFNRSVKSKMLCCGGLRFLAIYDYQTKLEHKRFNYSAPVSVAKFSPDGTKIAYALGSVWQYGLDDLGLYASRVYVHKVDKSDLGLLG